MAGCAPRVTFPSHTIKQSIEGICRTQYDLDAVAGIAGRTVGVMSYVDRLVDESGNVDQEVIRRTLGDLILTVTRVALSTDVEVSFVIVSIRGREDQNEIRVIRNLDDIKKAQTEALSVDESLSRTLWEQFKYRLDPIDPYYFPLDDMSMETFFEKQIVQRIRFANQAGAAGNAFMPSELIDGKFSVSATKGRIFEFSIVSFESVNPELNVLKVLRVINEVFKGYRFQGFDLILIKDLLSRKMLTVNRQTLQMYQDKSINEDEILRLGFKDDFSESERLRNALEIFGFSFQ